MTPEEFEENQNNQGNFVYRLNKYEFAEAYHKHRVESISDEYIEELFCMGDISAVFGAKWFKEELLDNAI